MHTNTQLCRAKTLQSAPFTKLSTRELNALSLPELQRYILAKAEFENPSPAPMATATAPVPAAPVATATALADFLTALQSGELKPAPTDAQSWPRAVAGVGLYPDAIDVRSLDFMGALQRAMPRFMGKSLNCETRWKWAQLLAALESGASTVPADFAAWLQPKATCATCGQVTR